MADVVIIGAGPAGVSAALTLRARNKEVLLVSNNPLNSPLAKAELVDNYPGLPRISGADMLKSFIEQIKTMGIEYREDRVVGVMPFGASFMVSIGSDVVEAGSVILAIGAAIPKPYQGEQEFLGRGVSYCATCDGMLYRGRRVCVIGKDEESQREANFLKEIGCEVTFFSKEDAPFLSSDVEHVRARKFEIQGSDKVEALKAEGETIPCEGIFILRPALAPASLVPGLEMEGALIKIDEGMMTSVPGLFAAGDCVGKPFQIAKAVGQGQTAAFSAVAYLEQ